MESEHSSEIMDKITYAEFKNQLKSAFVPINRKEEDKEVVRFQETGDMEIIEQLYKNRITTIRTWANRYHYLASSTEDLFADLSFHFVNKVVPGYNKKKGSFNTFLYTSFLNYVRNILTGLSAKKRTPKGHDGKTGNFLLSLDYNYSCDENGSTTLKDIISNEMVLYEDPAKTLRFSETIDALSCDDDVLKVFFVKLSEGATINSIVKECKTHEGKIKLDCHMAQKLSRRKCNKIVSGLIKQRKKIKDEFDLIDYKVVSKSLHYKIEMHNNDEADHFIKSIRKIRKHKDYYMAKMS